MQPTSKNLGFIQILKQKAQSVKGNRIKSASNLLNIIVLKKKDKNLVKISFR